MSGNGRKIKKVISPLPWGDMPGGEGHRRGQKPLSANPGTGPKSGTVSTPSGSSAPWNSPLPRFIPWPGSFSSNGLALRETSGHFLRRTPLAGALGTAPRQRTKTRPLPGWTPAEGDNCAFGSQVAAEDQTFRLDGWMLGWLLFYPFRYLSKNSMVLGQAMAAPSALCRSPVQSMKA